MGFLSGLKNFGQMIVGGVRPDDANSNPFARNFAAGLHGMMTGQGVLGGELQAYDAVHPKIKPPKVKMPITSLGQLPSYTDPVLPAPTIPMYARGGSLRKAGDVAIIGDAGPELAVKRKGDTVIVPLPPPQLVASTQAVAVRESPVVGFSEWLGRLLVACYPTLTANGLLDLATLIALRDLSVYGPVCQRPFLRCD